MGKGSVDGCGASCLRYITFIFNFCIFVIGAGLIGVGIWALLKLNQYSGLTDGNINVVGGVCIGLGVFVFLVGFLGCCGALKESTCMLRTFGTIITIIFIIEVIVAIVGGVEKGKIDTLITNQWNAIYPKCAGDNCPNSDGYQAAVAVQQAFHCCGISNYTEWQTKGHFNSTTPVPMSCCITDTTVPSCGSQNYPSNIYNVGCLQGFQNWIKDHLNIIIGVLVGLGLIQVLAVVVACHLAKKINKGEYYSLA
eukprot:CAMPEP_0204575974 /NCGR_PEP_ID=MMETSP0661-20131031/41502_1 /ASSEMBLY_ACC=CAM_ASM_000606 /TAXON_ID=109239 /ORGANISM="Alexandrium margalefi, Strain AMGDE01CS-322" /LENGTH=251 /DNA_ID=CAMNT_0051584663 /DNA_START=20 /DNA_END=775 /DNA_ORIENTATION=-